MQTVPNSAHATSTDTSTLETSPRRLPQPTNKQSRLLLQRQRSRLALNFPRPLRNLDSIPSGCIFCGQSILRGEMYRRHDNTLKAHESCFKEVAKGGAK